MNVAKKATEVYDELVKRGYHNIPVLVHKKESVWHREYAIFIIQFDTPYFYDDKPYETHEFDYDQFEADLIEYMEYKFPYCSISYNRHTYEFEILGEHYAAYYDDNIQALEDLSEQEGHAIYDENS